MSSKWLKFGCSIAVLAMLSACGGGGGGNPGGTDLQSSSMSTTSYPVASTFASFFSKASTYTLQTSVGATNLRLVHAISPQPDAIEPSLSSSVLKSFKFTERIFINNVEEEEEASIVYFSVNPFFIWGERDEVPEGVLYEVLKATSKTAVPETARVGQSGEIGVWSYSYTDENNISRQDTTTLSWSLEEASEATAWLCLQQKAQDHAEIYIQRRCVRTNEAGAALDYKVDYIVPTGTYQFR